MSGPVSLPGGAGWLTNFALLRCDRLNATVIGSKGAKEGDEPAEGEEESAPAGEANGEAKEAMEEAVQEED